MHSDSTVRPPLACRLLLRVISLIVRKDSRSSWFARREANLRSLWILAMRGEFARGSFSHLAWLCREAVESALLIRRIGFSARRWLRGPAFLMAAVAAAVAAIAIASHGLVATRGLLDALRDTAGAANQNRLVANLFPVAFALAAGFLVAAGRVSLRGHSSRYRAFLLFKTLSLATIAVLLWVEGGATLRGYLANPTLRVLAGGVMPAVFAASMCWAMLWSVADQQHRCALCLRRLVMPVRMGSWGSVFEPAAIEWVCEDGHGAFCEQQVEAGAPDHWIALEASQ
jgi:hypothetical protein